MWITYASTFVLGGLLALPALSQQSSSQSSAQDSSSAQGKQQTQKRTASKNNTRKSAAQENPFPADASRQAAGQPPQNRSSATPDAPAADQQSQSGQKPGDAAKDNPFPEDVSRSAAAAAAKDSDAAAGASSSSSSSNPGGADNPDPDIPPDTGRRKLRKPSDKDIQSGSLAGEGRAQEDIRVGRFYLGSGNYKGAYGRFSEAVQLDPTNINAIYGLAASADGLHRTEEALANYKLYLEIAPDGDKAKSARKALLSLSK